MDIVSVIILAVIQGVTEFLPISSSGHLVISSYLLDSSINASEQSTLIIVLHTGTLFSVLLYYRQRIINLINLALKNYSLVLNIVLATTPAFITGFLFSSFIENTLNARTLFIMSAAGLVFSGIVFISTSKQFSRNIPNPTSIENLTPLESIKVGLFQAVSVLYGVSRSGMTLTGTSFTNLSKQDRVDFAFLLSIPVLLGAIAYTLIQNSSNGFMSLISFENGVGVVVSFIVGLISIKWLVSYLKKNSLIYFGIYCIGLAIVSIIVDLLQ